jgi:hypothetical protein
VFFYRIEDTVLLFLYPRFIREVVGFSPTLVAELFLPRKEKNETVFFFYCGFFELMMEYVPSQYHVYW